MSSRAHKGDDSHYRAEVYLREGGQRYNVISYNQQQLIADVLDQYENHLHFLYILRSREA
jgi:choline/glycine/proline betaine transport protein